MKEKILPSPNQYLRARRPERFSDSVSVERPGLDRSLLEYHLDTVTSRGQETQFERFARRLAEREVCPNLLPHTGPTGGGDSKVDSETYPVADSLSFVWHTGIGREAASERWGFAFSAKRDWRAKVRSDVAKIVSTGRGYAKAIFVTSQYVPDKERALIEDELRKSYSLDVRILDRTWILDRVFGNHHEALASKELEITTPVGREVRRGPLDTQREQDLEEVEQRIQAAVQAEDHGFQLVEDCLSAALLARGLERPRTEVEGRFARAEAVALKYGTQHQQLVSAYQHAWTTIFWYEDYAEFVRLYGVTEERAKDSRNAYDLQLLTNLWFVLQSTVQQGALSQSAAVLPARTATLTASLDRLSKEEDRASTALQARTLLLQMRLVSGGREQADLLLHELRDVVRQSEGLVGYPLQPLAEIVGELGAFLGDLQSYNELFEVVVETTSRRAGEAVAARALLARGARQLDAERPYAAIHTLGRALGNLLTHESRRDLVRALYLCANAYERVGLLWAARGTLLVASSVATNDYWTQEEVTPAQAVCYNRLKWLELQLGRVPHILAWHELDRTIIGVLAHKGYNMDRAWRAEVQFDALLGVLFLKSDLWTLKRLEGLPHALAGMGLNHAAAALLYGLGYTEEVAAEITGQEMGERDMYAFFAEWRKCSDANELPDAAELCDRRRVTLTSRVLGCRVMVTCENTSPCVELAESTIAALEALLSTAPSERMIAREPVLTISIRKNDQAETPFDFEVHDRDGQPEVDMRCQSFNSHSMSRDEQANVKQRLVQLLVQVLAHVVLSPDDERAIRRLFDDGHAVARSVDLTTSFVTIGNVLGRSAKTNLLAWVSPDAKTYPSKRSQEWDAEERRQRSQQQPGAPPIQPNLGTGEPSAELSNLGVVKHTDMETVSLIRLALWDQAGWCGTVFLWGAKESVVPVLAPMFRNGDAGRQILAQWRKELGPVDTDERLRVTIIRGIARSNPYAYRVVIGANLPAEPTHFGKTAFIMVSRLNTMTPTSDANLQHFLKSYTTAGRYYLAGAVSTEDRGPVPVSDVHIEKRELNVRDAWQIGMNDPDVQGIRDDDPLIPSDQPDAPVLGLLKWLRERSRSDSPISGSAECHE